MTNVWIVSIILVRCRCICHRRVLSVTKGIPALRSFCSNTYSYSKPTALLKMLHPLVHYKLHIRSISNTRLSTTDLRLRSASGEQSSSLATADSTSTLGKEIRRVRMAIQYNRNRESEMRVGSLMLAEISVNKRLTTTHRNQLEPGLDIFSSCSRNKLSKHGSRQKAPSVPLFSVPSELNRRELDTTIGANVRLGRVHAYANIVPVSNLHNGFPAVITEIT
jgi:hypothetical protein